MAVVPHPSEKTVLRSSYKWASRHEFVPVEETSSVEQGVAPQGFQELLVRLVKAVLINKPLCIYECLATALEAELDRRTLWEMQFSQYSRSMPTSSTVSLKVPFHLLPRTVREVGDASDILPGKLGPRNLTSGSEEQELALVSECFPNREKSSLDPKRLKPFLAFEFPHGGTDGTRDEIRVASLSVPQNSSLLAVKAEGLKHFQPEDAVSTTASGVIEPVLGELSKDRSAADMTIDSYLQAAGMENMSPIRPTTEFLLRGHNPLATDGDQDELQDRHTYLLGNWHDSSLKDASVNEEIDRAGQNKTVKSQTRGNSLHTLDTKSTDAESRGRGRRLASDSSDLPSYIPRGDRLADAVLHLDAKTASAKDLELHEDVAAVASTDQNANALNKIFARFYQEPGKSHSGQDSYIVPRRYDVAITASNPDFAVLHEASETTFLQGTIPTTHTQDSNVVQSRNELADAVNTDGRVMDDEPQTTYPENSSQDQDVRESYLTSETKEKCLELVRALEEQQYRSSSYLESTETDELEYITPPNESFRQFREEFQEEDEFHTPRGAMFPDDMVQAGDEEMSTASVHVLRDRLLLASYRSEFDEELTTESGIQEFPQSNESTQSEGVTTESVAEGFPLDKETTHDKEINDEPVIHDFPHNAESTQDEELTIKPVVEGVLHGKKSKHDKETYDVSVIQGLSHSDDLTQDEELTTESVVEGVLHGKESMHEKETYDESVIQGLSHSDDLTQDEELTIAPVVEGVLLGKESMHEKETYDESVIQGLSHSDDLTQDEELTTEYVVEEVLHGRKSKHDKETYDESVIQELSQSDESVIQELSQSDESNQDEQLTIEPVVEGVLHGKRSKHNKETSDESRIQELSHSDEPIQDEELTTESVIEGVLHGKESMHEKETYDESVIQGLSHSDDLMQDEELTTESVVEGVLHGKESMHDKETSDESQIPEQISHIDESTQNEELTTESVAEGFPLDKETTHDKEINDEPVIHDLPHNDESTQDEELTIESVVEGVLHGKKSKHDKEIIDDSVISEIQHGNESTQSKGLTSESMVEEFLHVKDFTNDKETSDELMIQEFQHSDESTQGEELTSDSVVEQFPNVKESTHDQYMSNKALSQEFSPSDEKTEGEGLKFKTEFQEFPRSNELLPGEQLISESHFQDFPQDEESAQNKGLTSVSTIQVSKEIEESANGKKWMSEGFGEFQSSGESAQGEDFKSELGMQEFRQGIESTCSNEVIPNSVCGEETTLDSVQAKETVNDSASRNQMTVSSANETEMQPGSSLEEEMLYESMLGEEMNFGSSDDKEMPKDTVIGRKRSQIEKTCESKFDEENPTLENVKIKLSDSVYSEEITLKALPDEEMIHDSELGEEISPEREHTEVKKSDLVYGKYITCESKLHDEICEPENADIKPSDSVFSKDNTPESRLLEEIPVKSEHGEMKVSDSHYGKDITPESLLHEVIQPEAQNSEVRITDSVYSKDIRFQHDKDTTAEDLQAETQQSSEGVNETVNPDEEAMYVTPVREPLLYGQNIFANFSHASESEISSVTTKPSMSEEKTANMLEWDEMNLDRRESDVILHKQYTSSENPEQDDIFPEKEEQETSVTESESDTAAGQPSLEVAVDHPDCFSNFSMGPSSGREARIRLKWYSISTSCSDVLEEEDEEDESNIPRSQPTLQDDVSTHSEELTQNQQEESMAVHLTKSELTNEMVSSNDLFDKNESFELQNVSETDATMFPFCANRQPLTLEDGDQSLCTSVEVAESLTNSGVLPENSESLAVKMVTKISGEDLFSNICEKKMSTSDSLYMSDTFTEETALLRTNIIEKTKEMEDDQSDVVKECQVHEEPNQIKSAWDVDTGEEIQVDETVASGKYQADETEDKAEKASVLENTTDAQMITEVIDDKFTSVKPELTEEFSSKTELIQLMNEATLEAERSEQMSTPDEAEETKSVHKADIDDDDVLCLVETETTGKEMTNTVHTSDTESLEATSDDIYKTEETETNKGDLLRLGATVANFSDEAVEMSVLDETAEEKGMMESPADEFQSTGMPEIQKDVAADSRALDSAQETDEPELQRILFEPGSYVTVAKFKEKSTEEIEPEETTSFFESSSNLSNNSPDQNWFASRLGQSLTTEYSPAHFQLTDENSEETDTIQEFKTGVDSSVTEVTDLDSHKNQGMPAERACYETIIPEKANLFFAAAPGQSNIDSEYPSSHNKTKEESTVEDQGEEISPVYPTYMQDAGESKDGHEHIILLQHAPTIFATASMHSDADIDEPNLTDDGDAFFYVERDRDRQEIEPKFLLAQPHLVAKDSEEVDVIREIKDYGEYFSSHPCTRSRWEIPVEEYEIIVPQKVDIYSAPPIHTYHGMNDSDSKEKAGFYFGEETNTGLKTNEKSSCEEDESAVNDQLLCSPENYPTDVFGFPLDALKTSDETKLNDDIVPGDESSTSKSCCRNEPLEHEETSTEWPPLPDFLTASEENTRSAKRSSVYYRDGDWPRMTIRPSVFHRGESSASDSEGEEASIYWTEPAIVKPRVADSVSRQNPPDNSDVAAEVYNNKVNDRCDTIKNNEQLQAFFNARALESEEWPPMPVFAFFHNESDGMESKNAIGEAQSATGTTVGTTEDRMNERDLTETPDNQLMDSSENWPPLPDFILDELVSGRPKSSLNAEPSTFGSVSQAELPLGSAEFPSVAKQIGMLLRQGRIEIDPFTGEAIYDDNSCSTDVREMAGLMSQTDKDEALSEFLNADNFDDNKVDEQLELSAVNRLVLEIVSSAKQSVQELADRENLATFDITPESAWDFGSENPLILNVLSDDQTANSDQFATDLHDSDYEEASIYWTEPKPPVADSVSLQSSPDDNAPETAPGSPLKITGPQNNEAGFEVRQFCAVASSAFTDLTKMTGSQGDMKSHHNIQSHIELGIMACQSWSDLDILPCGSSKSLQLIGAPELSSWVAGSDEANRKWREDEQVGRRQVAEADSQSTNAEREAIRKVMETEDIDSGYKIEATKEPLLGCRRDSASIENEGDSRGSSVHIWMPVEEEGLPEEIASKGVVAKSSGVMSSPMELREKASEQQSSDVAEAVIALEGTVEPFGAMSAESNAVMEMVPIIVPKDCATVTKSPDADDWGKESNKVEVPDEFDFGTVFNSTSLLTGTDVSDPKQENIILDAVEPSGGSNSETDLDSAIQLPKKDTEVLSRESEEVEKDDVALGLIDESTNLPCGFMENKLLVTISSVEETKSDDSVPAEQTVELDKPMKQTETSSVERMDPTGISASETDVLLFEPSNNMKELRTEMATGSENWEQMDQSSAGVPGELYACATEMSDVQEPSISGHSEAQQEAVINSAQANDEMTNLQELLMSDHREPHQPFDGLNHVSCSLCKTDRAALPGYPDTVATPLSESGSWIQMGRTWIVEDEMLTSAEPSCRRNDVLGAEEETKCLSSFSSTFMATDEVPVGENRENSPTFERVETVDEEVKLAVSTGMDASLTQPASFENDNIRASNESDSTISLIDANSHLSYSPQVVEVEDSNMGLGQDESVQGEVDEDIKPAVSTGLTQPASFENDKMGASSDSASTISLIEADSNVSYSPLVVEMEDSNIGLDQDDWVQDEVDEDVFGVQEHHFLSNASTPGKQMQDNILSDTSTPRTEQQRSFGAISEQLDLVKPDGSRELRLGDSTKVTRESVPYSTDVSLELVDENVVTDDEVSDPSFMQRMPFPDSSGAELSSLSDRFMKLNLRTSSNQLENEAVDNSKPSASLPRKGEDEGQHKNQEDRLVEEEHLTVSSSDFPKSLRPELSPIIHGARDVESETESLNWEDRMHGISASSIGGENRVASEGSQIIDSDVEKEMDISRQLEALGNFGKVEGKDKDHDGDPNKDCEEGIHTETENELDNHERGLDKTHDKGRRDKNDNEDQDKNSVKDLDGDYNEDQDTNPDVHHNENQDENHDKDHDVDRYENQEKYPDKDHDEDQDMNQIKDTDMSHCKNQDKSQDETYGAEPDTNHNKLCKEDHSKDHDIDHDHHTGPVTIANEADSLEDIGKELGLVEVSTTEENDEYVESIPPHSTRSETDLVFSLHENPVEYRFDSDVEPLDKGSTSPVLTAGKDITIIPVDVLDQTPRSQSPSTSPVFLVASEHGGFKIANLEEQDTFRSNNIELERESQEQNELEQGVSDDGQKTYFRTTSSKADDETFASETAEGILPSNIDVTSSSETDDKVVSKGVDETFAPKTIEGIFISKVDETSASETDGDTVVSNIKDGTWPSKIEEGIVVSKCDGLNASKTDDKPYSGENDEGIVASETADIESSADDERKVSKNDDGTIEPYDGVVASEIDIKTEDDGTVTSKP